MSAPDPARLALEHALASVCEAKAALEAALGEEAPPLPLKEAAHAMGLKVSAARKRAYRGAGLFRDGRWFLPQSYVNDVRAAKGMST